MTTITITLFTGLESKIYSCTCIGFKAITQGVVYICINLGILPLCTEPLNDTSCMSKLLYLVCDITYPIKPVTLFTGLESKIYSCLGLKAITQGGFYIYVNLGILPLCTEPFYDFTVIMLSFLLHLVCDITLSDSGTLIILWMLRYS